MQIDKTVQNFFSEKELAVKIIRPQTIESINYKSCDTIEIKSLGGEFSNR